jgi:hypothetical protein
MQGNALFELQYDVFIFFAWRQLQVPHVCRDKFSKNFL